MLFVGAVSPARGARSECLRAKFLRQNCVPIVVSTYIYLLVDDKMDSKPWYLNLARQEQAS